MQAATSGRQTELTLLQERSAGTFARVYMAEARDADGLSRIVAVKVLKEQWSESEEVLKRTRDEARLLARLRHKNILRVEALAEIHGQPAIIMEFVDGIDLKQLIDLLGERGVRIPPRSVYRLIKDTAGALEAAYFKVPYGLTEPLRVIHRDIKPSNVMIDIEGEVKVLDFGTARFNHEARAARTGVLRFGSMKYMSPERRVGDRGDHASDIYALGLLFFEMLTGRTLPLLPLDKNEHDQFVDDQLAALTELGLPNDQWEDSLRQTMARMVAHDPRERLQAGQVAQLTLAFADQATGESLDAFASSTITDLVRQIYGGSGQGALSGSRVFVAMSTSGDHSQPRLREGVVATASLPGDGGDGAPDIGAPGDASPAPAQTFDQPTRITPQPAQPQPAAQPAVTHDPHPAVHAQVRHSTPPAAQHPPNESPMSHPLSQPPLHAAPQPDHTPGLHQPLSSDAGTPPPPKSNRTLIIVAAVIVAMLGFGMVVLIGGAGAAYYVMSDDDAADADDDGSADASTPASPAPSTPDAAQADFVLLSVEAGDDTVQWVKVHDADGTQILKASPAADQRVDSGHYTVSAKVVGRSKASAELLIDADAELSCTPEKGGNVRCDDAAGGPGVLLTP